MKLDSEWDSVPSDDNANSLKEVILVQLNSIVENIVMLSNLLANIDTLSYGENSEGANPYR